MQLGDFLTKLAAKSGKDLPEGLKSIMAQHGEIDLPKADSLFENLLSEKEAQNSTEVKNHFFAQFANATDTELSKFKDLLGDDYTELEKEKTFKRIGMLKDKLSDKLNEAKKANSGDDVKKYQDEINELSKTLKELPKKFQLEKQELEKSYSRKLVDKEIGIMMSAYQFNDAIPEAYRLQVAKTALEKALKSSDAMTVEADGTLKLVRASDPALEVTGVTLKGLMDKTFAEEKLLKTSEPAKPGTPAPIPATPQSGSFTVNSIFKRNAEAIRAEAEANAK
jgi:hypothetical protein